MISGFVADASVAVAWVHPAQATSETAAMLKALGEGIPVEVPSIWPVEVANALLVLVRRRLLTEDDRVDGLEWLREAPVRIDHESASLALTRLSTIAADYNLSIYDAAYLELAQRRRLLLGCRDRALRHAAKRAGVTLWS